MPRPPCCAPPSRSASAAGSCSTRAARRVGLVRRWIDGSIDDRSARGRGRRPGGAIPSCDIPLPQPLAALRGGRRRPQARSSTQLMRCTTRACSAPTRWSTSPSSACCSTPAPAPTGSTSSPPAGRPSPAPRAWASPASTPSCAGLFSSDKNRPLQVDAKGLRALVTDQLAAAFQVSDANPLVGLEGRAVLLRRLGEAMPEQPGIFGAECRGPPASST